MKTALSRAIQFANAGPYYLGIGGLGDLILTLGTLFHDPSARLIFWATTGLPLVAKKMLLAFGVKEYYLLPAFPADPIGRFVWEACYRHRNLVAWPIAPYTLDYDEWASLTDEYTRRLVPEIPLIERFGTVPKDGRRVLCLVPKGSLVQKTVYPDEFRTIVNRYFKEGWKIYAVGGLSEITSYQDDRCDWINTDYIKTPDRTLSIDTKTLFRVLNSCDLVISVDTWVKTYTCMAGIETLVLRPRLPPHQHAYFQAGDHIFLNPGIWKTMKLLPANWIDALSTDKVEECQENAILAS